MVAPTTFLTFINPDTKYVLSTPNYPDMELLDPYEKGAPQSVKKSRELSHSKAHIRAHLETLFQNPIAEKDATLKPAKRQGFHWVFDKRARSLKDTSTLGHLSQKDQHDLRVFLSTGEIYAEVSKLSKNQYKSSTSSSDSEGDVITKTPQHNLPRSSFNPINGKTPKNISRTPKPHPTIELKKPKPLNQLGAGEHSVHPKQTCSPHPSKTSVGLGKRQRLDDKEGDSEIGISNKQIKLQTPKSIPKTMGPTSGNKTQNLMRSGAIDDNVLMKAMFSGASGVRDLIDSTLKSKAQEFDLEKKRLVLEKIELQEKLDAMSEQVQRLKEQVNTLEEICIPPEFMERLGAL